MNKTKFVFIFFVLMVFLDMLTTYIVFEYFVGILKETNNYIIGIYMLHPLMLFAYVPFCWVVMDAIYFILKNFDMETEGRACVVIGGLTFAGAVVNNTILILSSL